MGSCMSGKLLSSSISNTRSSSSDSKRVKVVHLNGWTEEFEEAVTVEEVTGGGKHQQEQEGIPKHFVFKILSVDSKPLDSTAQLEVGNNYFMLPHSFFQTSEMSHLDFATLSKRLNLAAAAAEANNSNITQKKKKKKIKQQQEDEIKLKRNRYADRYANNAARYWDGRTEQAGELVQFNHLSPPCTWKPILESITETSFTLTPT